MDRCAAVDAQGREDRSAAGRPGQGGAVRHAAQNARRLQGRTALALPGRERDGHIRTLYLGMGDKLDTKSALALSAGGFHFLPGKVHHYAFAKVPTVVQVNTSGPFDMTYINPDDDPQKAKK
jgi:hypothetical protein